MKQVRVPGIEDLCHFMEFLHFLSGTIIILYQQYEWIVKSDGEILHFFSGTIIMSAI